MDGARFCDACGAPVGETRPAEAVAAVRKVVTILFADLSGSTALQERLDAETTRRVMDRVHRLLGDAIATHEGRVVKFTGDGLMAVFGIPVLREDDALRAVRAGVAMQEAFATLATELQRDLGAEIGLRVGVNTGEVVVSPDTDDIVGDPVNVAARLEAAAAVGEVLIGVETGRLVRDAIAVEAIPALAMKGKELPVAAMRIAASEAQTSVVATAFVGREVDLERLVAAFDEAAGVGQARLVTVVGSPGLGKSRLASEVAARLSERATVLEARCTPSGGSSFGPVVDAIRRALRLDESALEDTVREAITVRCPRLAGDTERVAVTVAALVTGSPAGSAEQLFWSVRRLFEALAQDRPVVLLVDDVHWAEPALLDLVEHIAEWARGPMLVLALARPELRERRPTLVEAGGPSSAVIVLGALDDTAARHLAFDLLATDDLPGGVLGRALEAGEGNPLFLRELLRLLVDDGVLRRVDGRWRATVDEGGIELPATIHAALAARIEQLRPAERTLLETASVIGRHFPRGALLELLPEDVAADLDTHLDTLRRRELVDAESTWWANDRLYRFHHALIRDAAYRRVLKEVRADLHARYSTWLETVAEVVSEQDEALGWHLEQAHGFRVELGQLYDEETGRLAERASTHLATAARRAFDRDDVASAASLLGRALLLTPVDDPRRLGLMRGHCDALISCGDMEAAALAVAELVASATTDHAAAIADVFEAQLAGQRSPEELRSVAERTARAAKVFAEHGDDTGVAHTELVLASAMAALGQVAACEAALDRALAAARRSDDRRRANAVLAIAPLAALWGPSPVARASGRCLDVIRVLRITSWAPQVEAHALRAQAVLEALRDRPEASRRMIESARHTFSDLGQPLGLLEVETHAGIVELLAGEPGAAEPHLRRAREGFNELGSRVGAARASALLARALLELDRLDEAAALADPSIGGDDLKATIGLLGVRAEVLARRGGGEEAERLARQAVEIASGTDALLDHADARLALSRVLAAAGRSGEAAAEAARARDLYEAKGSVVGVRRAGMTPTTAPVDAPPVVDRRARPNAVSRYVEDVFAAVKAGDITEVARRYYTPDSIYVHHLTGEELRGDEQLLAMAEYARRRQFEFVHEVLLTFGERLALYRLKIDSDEARPVGEAFDPVGLTELELVLVAELDEARKVVRTDVFPPDRLDQASAVAFARQADLATDPVEARAARALSGTAAFYELVNAGAWSELEALFSPEVEAIDHRLASTHLAGRDDWISYLRSAIELAGGVRFDLSDFLAVDVRRGVALAGTRLHGHLPDAGAFDMPTYFACVVGADGLVSRVDMFDPEQHDDAFALFDELVGEDGAPAEQPAARRRITPNLATANFENWLSAVQVGDTEALERLQGPELRPEDLFAAGVPTSVEPIAAVGRRQAVCRVDDQSICVAVTDAAGVLTEIHRFASDQLSPAMVLLVEMWAERELDGAESERALATREFWLSPNPFGSDWQARYHAPDAVVVDHRPAGWGTLHGRAAVAEQASALAALADDFRGELVDVYALTAHVAATRFDVSGTPEGGAFTRPTVTVQQFGHDGLVTRSDIYAPEQTDEALAFVDELTASVAPSVSAPSPTAATRLTERWREAMVTADAEKIGAIYSPDVVAEDRRPLFQRRVDGREAAVAAKMVVAAQSGIDVQCEPVATRGDRLMLMRTAYVGPSYRVELLNLFETDETGQNLVRTVAFEPEQEDAAYAELDHRAVAIGGEQWAGFRVVASWAAAYGTGDVERLRDCFTPDAVVVDHRPARFGAATRDQFVDLASELFALAESTALRIVEVPIATTRATVFRMRTTGRMAGGSFENESWASSVFDEGRLGRLELFAPEGRADAEASLVASVGSGPAPTAVTRLMERWRDAMTRADPEAIGAIYAPDVVTEDRRPTLQNRVEGRAASVESLMVAVGRGGVDVRCEPLATRGERLALMRTAYVGEKFRVDLLHLCETDATGRHLVRGVGFEPEQEDAAYAELDRRAVEVGGPGGLAIMSAVAAYGTGDVERLRDCFVPDAVIVDHRPAQFGAHGVEEFLERTTSLFRLTASTKFRLLEIPIATTLGSVSRLRTTGLTADGGAFEIERWMVGIFRDGQLERLEIFSADDRADAETRFGEVARGPNGPSPNSASRHLERWCEAITRGDTDLLAALSTPDVVTIDRRRLVGSSMDAQATTLNLQWLAGRRDLDLKVVLLATRGDRLALARQEYRHPLTQAEMLAIHEVTADGRVVQRGVILDLDDEDAAYAELDERAAALEEPFVVNMAVVSTLMAAMNRRDADGIRAGIAPEAVTVDHRPARFGVASAEEFVARARTLFELVDVTVYRVTEVPRTTGPVSIWRVSARGETVDGGRFENEDWSVGVFRDGLLARLEQFPIDAFAEAEARFRFLATHDHKPASNAATLHFERFVAALMAADPEELRAMCAPDIEIEDRRPIIAAPLRGVDVVVENWMFLAGRAGHRFDWAPIATRGSRLALVRADYSDDGMELERLAVVELMDDEVRCQRRVVFAVDDEDAAYAELDARAFDLAGEAAGPLRGLSANLRTNVPGDELPLHPDATFIDHTQVGWGVLNTAGYLDLVQATAEAAENLKLRLVEVPRLSASGALFRIRVTGDAAGGAFELEWWRASKVVDGLVVRLEQFPLEQRAEAEACFERLTAPSHVPAGNSAVRFCERWVSAMRARDEAALTDLCARDILVEDRRPIVGLSLRGAEAAVANWMLMQTIADRGTDLRSEVLATRGDRLALVQLSLVGGIALFDVFVLSEVDGNERCKRRTVFSLDDEDAAYAELDVLAGALEGDVLRPLVESVAAYNAHDIDRFGAWFHADCAFVNHAPAGWGSFTTAEYLAYCQSLFDLTDDARVRALEVASAERWGFLTRFRMCGRRDGGYFAQDAWIVTGLRDGRIARHEQFLIERRADADECFEGLPR